MLIFMEKKSLNAWKEYVVVIKWLFPSHSGLPTGNSSTKRILGTMYNLCYTNRFYNFFIISTTF